MTTDQSVAPLLQPSQHIQLKLPGRTLLIRRPFSNHCQSWGNSSKATVEEAPKPKKESLRIGLRFSSFSEFEALFERWKAENYHPFRVASSETLRLPDGTVDPVFKYRYIVYHCAHYGAPRIRGCGKRRNQNYLPCGCQAMLRLNYSWSENALRLTTLCSVHTGHETSPEAYQQFSGKRVVRSAGIAAVAESKSSGSDQENQPDTPPPLPCHSPTGLRYQQWSNDDDGEDQRSDEDRFEMIHAVLQGLSDHLLRLQGAPFDARLTELHMMLRKWQARSPRFMNGSVKTIADRRRSAAFHG
uniref:FAR1 domain-containing protein n=1 Tax=Trichuris muris TaxID=70415 RepID=A0A5S6QJV0_TRIMR